MVSVVVFEFSGMRCQPLRRALYAFDTHNFWRYIYAL
ncbi:acetyltransferase [Vibrio cholerae]|nr:acetyltransferase [Vibrio cholerae]